MTVSRLTNALESGDLILPDTGRIVVLNARADTDLSGLDQARVEVVQGFYPDYIAQINKGYTANYQAEGDFTSAIVFLPRSKLEARALLADAARLTHGGLVVVDGQKTDGIAPIMKALKSRVDLLGTYSKAHGKLIWFQGGDFNDWAAADTVLEGGFITRPGVFSADGPDKGSVVLSETLPKSLKGKGVDLGAGWGYLSRGILTNEAVTALHVVEADRTALDCAKRNITDDRAQFHWADATRWAQDDKLNFVVMNPPFHTGRAGDPNLGRAFIKSAAGMLTPSGQLFMVANRHLPYEASLDAYFRHVTEIGGNSAFKVLHALRPRRKPHDMP